MKRYGVRIPELRRIAKKTGKNHASGRKIMGMPDIGKLKY